MKETNIEDLFAHYQPDLGDRDEYIERLSKKLEAAEYAKRYREAQTKRYRRMMVAVFISGVVTGSIGIVLVLLHPLWFFPKGIEVPVPAISSLFPKVASLIFFCFMSLCVTGLVGQLCGLNTNNRKRIL